MADGLRGQRNIHAQTIESCEGSMVDGFIIVWYVIRINN